MSIGNECYSRGRGGPRGVGSFDDATEGGGVHIPETEEEKYYAEDIYVVEVVERGLIDNPYRYAGYEYIEEVKLYDLNARYYNPEIARFLSADPYYNLGNRVIGLYEINIPDARSIMQATVLYAYCGNSPIRYVDLTGLWEEGDEKYSATMQVELLKLTYAWYCADTQEEKDDIHARAKALRESADSGVLWFADKAKTISGAAADEFSWFLGGDVDRAERDYWLTQVAQFQDITISEKTELQAIMFIASIGLPSIDDAYKFVTEKASKEMLETVGEKESKKFLKAITKYAGEQGANGIKKLKAHTIQKANL